MSATTDLAVALQDVDVIILSLPAQILPVWLARHKVKNATSVNILCVRPGMLILCGKRFQDQIPPKALLCNTAKGKFGYTSISPTVYTENRARSNYNGDTTLWTGLYLQNRQLQNEACLEALGRDQPYAILSGT